MSETDKYMHSVTMTQDSMGKTYKCVFPPSNRYLLMSTTYFSNPEVKMAIIPKKKYLLFSPMIIK